MTSARIRTAITVVAGLLAVSWLLPAADLGSLTAVAAIAAVGIAVAAAATWVALAPRRAVRNIGDRARAHRESTESQVEPAHPDTAGRVRSRAPGRCIAAA